MRRWGVKASKHFYLIIFVICWATFFLPVTFTPQSHLIIQHYQEQHVEERESIDREANAENGINWNVTEPEYPLPTSREPPISIFVFPNLNERIEYYMGGWDQIPKNELETPGTFWNNRLSSICQYFPIWTAFRFASVNGEMPAIFSNDTLTELAQASSNGVIPPNYLYYGQDVINRFYTKNTADPSIRIVARFGDSTRANFSFPVITKARISVKKKKKNIMIPILALLEEDRHYGPIKDVRDYTKWENKTEVVVFRGTNTGNREQIIGPWINETSNGIDVGLSFSQFGYNETTEKMIKGSMDMKELLTYKYLLSLEGNDVASGLKWMLYSNSVVFMPKPTKSTWAMEDKLVPGVHYVKVAADLSDLKEKLEWAKAHDAECQMISMYATHYIEQLYATQKARDKNAVIHEEMIRRYHDQFGSFLKKCQLYEPNGYLNPDNITVVDPEQRIPTA